LEEQKWSLFDMMEDLSAVIGEIKKTQKGALELLSSEGPETAKQKANEAFEILQMTSYPLVNCYGAMELRGDEAEIHQVYRRYIREYQEASRHREKLEDLAAWFHRMENLVWSDNSSDEIPKDLTKLSIIEKKFKIKQTALLKNIKLGKLHSYLFKDGRYVKRDSENTTTSPHFVSKAEAARIFDKKE